MATTGVILSSTLSDYQDQINAFVASYKTSISTPITTLNTKKDTYTKQKTAISDLLTKMKTLDSSLSDLLSTDSASKFKSNTITSSDTNTLTVTSTGISSEGNYSVSVKQLAKYDKIVSSSVVGTDANKFSNGKKSFTISVAGTDYNVDVDLSGETTNLSALRKIMNSINASDAGQKVRATIIQDSETTYRLVMTSKDTGSKNAISLSDQSGLLDGLGINADAAARTASNGTDGGYLYSDVKSLDSVFSVDGIEMTRSSNKITDVISGVSFELKSVQSSPEKNVTIGVGLDKDGVKSLIQTFITSYNDAITYLNQKVAVSTSGTKSEFSGDTTLMDLRQKLRYMLIGKVNGVNSNVDSLIDIGISINTNGTLTLKDTNKFNSVLENNVEDIANLFNSSDGMATKVSSFINKYIKTDGILSRKSTNIESQISAITTRITNTQLQIDKKTENVKTNYEKLLSTMLDLNNQQSLMSSITSSYGTSY